MIETITWIPVAERLPDDLKNVLFCDVDSDGVRYVLQGWREEDGKWYSVDDPEPFSSVFYWAAWPVGPRA